MQEQDDLLKLKLNIRLGNKGAFDRSMVVCGSLSISETDLIIWNFSHATISRAYSEWSENEKISSEWELNERTAFLRSYEGSSYSNNRSIQPWYAEGHL